MFFYGIHPNAAQYPVIVNAYLGEPAMNATERARDSSQEPIEVKIIAVASDGYVCVTPEKCEAIRKLLQRVEREARLDVLKDWHCHAPHHPTATETCWACEYIAELVFDAELEAGHGRD
jgi:hypothetical protein